MQREEKTTRNRTRGKQSGSEGLIRQSSKGTEVAAKPGLLTVRSSIRKSASGTERASKGGLLRQQREKVKGRGKRRRQKKKGGNAEAREHRMGKGRDELVYWEGVFRGEEVFVLEEEVCVLEEEGLGGSLLRRGGRVPRRETKGRKKGSGRRQMPRGVGEKRGEYRRGKGLLRQRGGVASQQKRSKGNGVGLAKGVWVGRKKRR